MNPTILALNAQTLPDFLKFFDTDAFADNPRWAFCYCQVLYVDHTQVTWKERALDENRASACDRVSADVCAGISRTSTVTLSRGATLRRDQ